MTTKEIYEEHERRMKEIEEEHNKRWEKIKQDEARMSRNVGIGILVVIGFMIFIMPWTLIGIQKYWNWVFSHS